MLSVYIGALVFGGVLLGASILGGHGHDGGNGGGGGDGHGGGGDGHGDHHQGHGERLPILSLRFWAFSLAFFGLAGTALTLAGVHVLTPVLAAGVGLGAGWVSARVLGRLAGTPLGVVADATAHVGREGRLLLPVARGQRGKIRLSVRGFTSDLIAETDADDALAAGETALIVGMRGAVALVERSPAAPAAPSSPGKEPA
jgi:membrane protein implicated in regulation of membrane protease activity